MEMQVNDSPKDEPLRQTHIRIYMEVTIPGEGGKRIAVSHDYSKEETICQLDRGNDAPLNYIGTQQWNMLMRGLKELKR